MSVGRTETGRDGESGSATETLLQEELQDLRSLVVHADHLRWVTRGPEAKDFDALVYRFSEDWRRWSESVASCLIHLGSPPDGRVSALTEGSYRAWLPDDWVEIGEAGRWITRELGVLSEWVHVRKEEAGLSEVVRLFEGIEMGIAQERTEFRGMEPWSWADNRPCRGAFIDVAARQQGLRRRRIGIPVPIGAAERAGTELASGFSVRDLGDAWTGAHRRTTSRDRELSVRP